MIAEIFISGLLGQSVLSFALNVFALLSPSFLNSSAHPAWATAVVSKLVTIGVGFCDADGRLAGL